LTVALETILRQPVQLTVAGRTDAGVHAWGQVVGVRWSGMATAPTAYPERAGGESKDLDLDRLLRSLNAILPDQVCVQAVTPAPDGFDARRDARSRVYCYRVHAGPAPSPFERGRALHWPHRLDREALDRCAGLLVGTHDFTAFTPTDTEHVRFERDVMHAEWRAVPAPVKGEMLEFWIEADAFMRNMVRVLVGTMLEVGGGRRTVDDFAALLNGAPRSEAGETAPPHGLYLAAVRY
jgi:tRNA pseudouridine38-40 synthase